MERDVMLLVTGALISLLSSFLTSVFNHRLVRRQWMEQKQWEIKKELREELGGTWQDLRSLIADDIHHQIMGSVRGEGEADRETELLPAAISRLEINTRKVIEALDDAGKCIEIGQLLHLALHTLNADAD